MIFRKYSSREKKVSLLGFGTWGLGSDAYGHISKKNSAKVLDFTIKNRINFIDTANIYGQGLAEKRIGDFISKSNILRSKFGNFIGILAQNEVSIDYPRTAHSDSH